MMSLHQPPVQWHDPMACGPGAHERKPLRRHPQSHGKPVEQIREMTWGMRNSLQRPQKDTVSSLVPIRFRACGGNFPRRF